MQRLSASRARCRVCASDSREDSCSTGCSKTFALKGHLIDSGIVSQVMDHIIAFGGEFEMLTFEVGRTNTDVSVAVLRVRAENQSHLDGILSDIQANGAYSVDASDA